MGHGAAAVVCGWLDGRSGRNVQTVGDHDAAIALIRRAVGGRWDQLVDRGHGMTRSQTIDFACEELATIHSPTSQSCGLNLERGASIDVPGLVAWAVDAAGARVAAGTATGVVVYDAESGEEIQRLGNTDLRGVAITAADQLLVGSVGGPLRAGSDEVDETPAGSLLSALDDGQ